MTTSHSAARQLPWLPRASLFGSGRDAISALARWGARERGWSRLWLPSYNCPEVPATLRRTVPGMRLASYPDAALDAPVELDAIPTEPGDVVVVVNQLGVRRRPATAPARARGVVVVEDHSHDPGSAWALESEADYAFASLRKTLPIPDGGAVWSPRGLELPPEPAGERRDTRVAASLAAGRGAGEDARLRYLALARTAAGSDEPVPGAAISPVSRALLAQMPVGAWRERRRENIAIVAGAVDGTPGVQLLEAPSGGVAFALTLRFDAAPARDAARRALVARAIVPVVLWPLDPARDWGAGPADAELSARTLSIHADQRFSADDARAMAQLVLAALRG